MLFRILGPIEVCREDGRPVAVGGPQVRALLALLLLDAGQVVGRERLIDGLYGEDPPADAAHALQSQVSRLRRGLREATASGVAVEHSSAGYRLAVDPDRVDAHRFGCSAEDGRRALAAGDPAAAATLLTEALSLWRGEALADVLDAPFAAPHAARLADARAAALEDRAAALLALGDHRAVAADLPELLVSDPLRERAVALLMRALSAGGRQAEALALFAQTKQLLADELGADPAAELTTAHLAILRAESTATPIACRMPAQLTSFVGRERELRQVAALLSQERLVTLTGPGGTGKTRLAVEIGARARGEAHFIDLSPSVDRAQALQAIAGALGVRETGLLPSDSGPADVESRLVDALADRAQLIILDNCEQVIDIVAALAHRLLAACPGLRILATSREALNITGETLFPLGQLAVPAPDVELSEALGSPAVRLFADRAAASRPGFVVDAGTIGPVRRICADLDGLPLAIELAAARLRTLALEEIETRLAQRFRLLSRGSRTAAPRHQTLRAVVQWSWDLLDAGEQALARRFTVFAGGATLTDAERVCDSPNTDDLLSSLVDKSLVDVDSGRYRMLATVREFCAERLAEAGETAQLNRRHAEYFVTLVEHADLRLRGPEQLEFLTRLAAEHANLIGALRWAVGEGATVSDPPDAGDPKLALRLIAASSWFWWLRGLRGESAPLATQLLDRLGSETPAEEYALCVATAAQGHGDPSDHLARAATAIANYDRPLQRPYLLLLLMVGGGKIDIPVEQQRNLFSADPWSQAFLRVGQGLELIFAGQPSAAEREFTAALDGFRPLGDRWAIATVLDKLAAIADGRGEPVRSVELMDEAITLVEQLGTVEDTADLLNRRADARVRRGAFDAARADYQRAEEFSRTIGCPSMRANAHRGLGDIARIEGDSALAAQEYALALELSEHISISAQETRARILIGSGWVAAGHGNLAQAQLAHRAGLAAAVASGNLPVAAGAVEGLADTCLLAGDAERAAVLLGAGAALRGGPSSDDRDVARVVAEAERLLGPRHYLDARQRGSVLALHEVVHLAGE
ncbi:BTAD domain-containing putative transcriptional regulator [Nocardia sp. NPDC051463]|uniref:BTAD domain-containing putative transcriptional regulator n=1 Tax=Nocardia sp. NPDC051463 TaxID=3154845 RepID=UPI003433C063